MQTLRGVAQDQVYRCGGCRLEQAAVVLFPVYQKTKYAMEKTIIHTDAAPQAIGAYSQAVRAGNLVFISGQIPLDPASGELVDGGADAQIHRVFKNLLAVCRAAGGDASHIVKLTVYLTDLSIFTQVNSVMAEYFTQPYPARAAVGVAALPKNALLEIEGILSLSG